MSARACETVCARLHMRQRGQGEHWRDEAVEVVLLPDLAKRRERRYVSVPASGGQLVRTNLVNEASCK